MLYEAGPADVSNWAKAVDPHTRSSMGRAPRSRLRNVMDQNIDVYVTLGRQCCDQVIDKPWVGKFLTRKGSRENENGCAYLVIQRSRSFQRRRTRGEAVSARPAGSTGAA